MKFCRIYSETAYFTHDYSHMCTYAHPIYIYIYACEVQRHLGWYDDIILHFLALLWSTWARWVVPVPAYWFLYLEIELFCKRIVLLLILTFEWNCSGFKWGIMYHTVAYTVVLLLSKDLETNKTTAVAVQWHGKHTSTTVELLLETLFSM
jgi:hypothetical protein